MSFCSSLLSCTNDDSFLAHDFETQQNRALSIYTGNYNIYQIAKKVSLPSASTTKLNSVITNCYRYQIKIRKELSNNACKCA